MQAGDRKGIFVTSLLISLSVSFKSTVASETGETMSEKLGDVLVSSRAVPDVSTNPNWYLLVAVQYCGKWTTEYGIYCRYAQLYHKP